MRFLLYILIGLVLASCSSSKTAKQVAKQMESAPEWVKERPILKSYYIGIAKVKKATYPTSYQEVAKKVALNDLASEISVNIQSNSIVSTYEDNAGFQSEFSRFIEMEMTRDLEGYQMHGSFETDNTYMVYYRLSKSKWISIQAERKKAAADRAFDIFQQAKKEEKDLKYPEAITNYVNALLELKKYWNEAVYHGKSENKIRLDLEIRSALLHILSDIKFIVEPSALPLNISNQFKNRITISVINNKGDYLSGFPIKLSYRKSSLPFQLKMFSEEQKIAIPIEDVVFKISDLYIDLEIIKNEVLKLKSEDKKLLKFISDGFSPKPVRVSANYSLPSIYISSNNVESPNFHFIKDAIQQALGKQNFSIRNNIDEADLIFQVSIHESKASTEAQLKSSFITYAVEVKNKELNSTIYTFSSPSYKGVDYSSGAAFEKAYRLAAEEISESSFNEMLKSILE